MVSPIIKAGLGLALGAAGTAKQIGAARSVARSQKSIANLNERQQQLQAKLRRRQAIRASVIRRAQAQAAGVAVGGQNSSSSFGGFSSLGSQLGGGLGYQSQGTNISREITSLSGNIAGQQASSDLGSGLARFGFGAFNRAGGFGAFN